MSTVPAVSVLVCAYTELRWNDLFEAVHALQTQTLLPSQIILITDHNLALFERAKAAFENITVIENNGERGLSGARNSGIAIATGDILAFMDEDAVPALDWIERMVTHYNSQEIIGVGGAIIPQWSNERPSWFPQEFDWVVGCTYSGMPTTPTPVRNLIGCNMSFRREVFDKIGGFINGIGRVGTRPVGCEETELCIRLHQRLIGKILLYDPAIYVRHNVTSNRAQLSYFINRCYSEGLSKALVATLVGSNDGLSSERKYVLQTLPAAVLRGLADGCRFKLSGFGRAGAIVIGLTCTAFGYLYGSILLKLKRNDRRLSPTENAV